MAFDNPAMNAGKLLRVGDTIVTPKGEARVARIVVTPRPTTDPAGEDCGVQVDAVELAAVPAVVDYEAPEGAKAGGWMYGREVTARRVTE
jgi:phage terminase large subunit-like protein